MSQKVEFLKKKKNHKKLKNRCIKDALDLKDQEKWKDPEFGPSNADPLGINSLFKNPHKKPSGKMA